MPFMERGLYAGFGTQDPAGHAQSALATVLYRSVAAIRRRAVACGRGLRSISPDRWFLVGFALLMLAFLFVLMLQPSAVGRGGR